MRVAGLGTAAADDDIAIVEGVGIGHRQHKAHFCIAPIATSSVSARTIQRVAMDRFKKMLQPSRGVGMPISPTKSTPKRH